MSDDHRARGALGMGWADWIKPDTVRPLEIPVDASDPISNQQIKIRPAPTDPNANMAVITMIEPLNEANFRALGYNMYSEPARRSAMDQAVRDARPTASGKVVLIQEQSAAIAPGAALIFRPVFARQGPADMIRGPLKGFVYTPDQSARISDNRRQGHAKFVWARGFVRWIAHFGRPACRDCSCDRRHQKAIMRRLDFAGRRWLVVVEARERPSLTETSLFVLGFVHACEPAADGACANGRRTALLTIGRCWSGLARQSSIRGFADPRT